VGEQNSVFLKGFYCEACTDFSRGKVHAYIKGRLQRRGYGLKERKLVRSLKVNGRPMTRGGGEIKTTQKKREVSRGVNFRRREG